MGGASAMTPTISIITAMRNAEPTIGEALASLRAQTFADWEAIVVDDASTDGSAPIVERIARDDPRVRLLKQGECAGPSGARNAGIEAARGRHIGFLDADDWLSPDALEHLLEVATANPGACAFGGVEYRGPGGEDLSWSVARPGAEYGLDELLGDARLTIMTLTPRETLGDHRFDESLTICEDMDLWLRLALEGARFVGAPGVVYAYRLRPASLTRNFARMRGQHERVLRRAFARARALGWVPRGVDCSATRLDRALQREALFLGTMAACVDGPGAGADVFEPSWSGEPIRVDDAVDLGLWGCAYARCGSRYAWPDLPGGWVEAVGAWWRRCEARGWTGPGFTDACAATLTESLITNERIAGAVVEELGDARRVVLLGFGANARMLARRLAARGVGVEARDDRIDAGSLRDLPAEVSQGRMRAALPARTPVVITTLQDDWLIRRFGDRAARATRWAAVRRRLIDDLRPTIEEKIHSDAPCAAA